MPAPSPEVLTYHHDGEDAQNRSDESAPLLSNPLSTAIPSNSHSHPSTSNSVARTVLYFMSIHFFIAFTDIIIVAPLIKLFETSLCLRYYGFPAADGVGGGLVGEGPLSCKIPEIQTELARVRGVKAGLDMMPVLLVAIPLGSLGDRFGRRRIMGISIVGVLASLAEVFIVCAFPKVFPVKLVWLSSMFQLFGGGLNTATAFMYSMASESIPEEKRSQGYYYIFAAFYVAELIASFTASMTIDISPWIPCGLAMISMLSCLGLLVFVKPPSPNRPVKEPSATDESGLLMKPRPTRRSPIRILLAVLSSRNVVFLVPIFLVSIFRYTTLNILIQYASVRFGLKISTGAMFYTEAAVVNIILFLLVIPKATELTKKKWLVRDESMDLWIARGSIGFLCVGALSIGLAQEAYFLPVGVLLFALGFGSSVSALSLVSHWIPNSEKPTVYAAVVVLQSLGHALSDPALLFVYSWGLGKGGKGDGRGWEAAPFFIVSSFYALACLSASCIRISQKTVG